MIPAVSILKPLGRLKSSFLICFILLGFCACARVYLLELRKRERRLLRVVARKALIKIRKVRFAALKLRDDQSHL